MKASEAIRKYLDVHGPTTGTDLEAALRADFPKWSYMDFKEGSAGDVHLLYDDLFVRDKWMHGRVFTHRLTQAEFDSDLIAAVEDLTVVLQLTPAHIDDWSLTDGSPVLTVGGWGSYDIEVPEALDDAEILFAFPDFWLDEQGFEPLDLIGFRYGPQGWSYEHVSDPDAGAQVKQWLPQGPDADVEYDLWRVVFEHDDAFRYPVVPLSTLR